MFVNLLKFFLYNSRMNYTLFVLLFLAGVYSYIKIPKEIFPVFELDSISLSGGYSGASISTVDKMIVTPIEDGLKNLDGIDEITTKITPGSFSMSIDITEGQNRYNLLNRVQDVISQSSINFPTDMNDPIARVREKKADLMIIDMSSNTLNRSDLIDKAIDIKSLLSKQNNISEVAIFGDSQKFINILVDEKKLIALNINPKSVFSAIGNFSYIFPIGKIEDPSHHVYISTMNGNYSLKTIENTKINIDGKVIYLKDIATIEKRYKDPSTYATIEGENAISLSLSKNLDGDAIVMSKELHEYVKVLEKKFPNINFTIHKDRSVAVKERLNIVTSNIFLSIILVSLTMAVLINSRIAFIVALGIPTSFIIGIIFLYYAGFTINLISLIGVLVAIGIVVDDAIVVSENIQHYIEKGLSPREASTKGTLEVIKPVTIASLTTLFSFIPILMISGTMGEFIKLIPIAVSALVVASLIESFIFLPIHAEHTLTKKVKQLNWDKVHGWYQLLLHFLIHYKKTFLLVFVILVPLTTIYLIKESRFQMFPRFDATTLTISIKAKNNTDLDQMHLIVKNIEKKILEKKQEYYIDTLSTITGFRIDSEMRSINAPNMGHIAIEFYETLPENFIDLYVTPMLALNYDDSKKLRKITSNEVAKQIRKDIKDLKQKYNLDELLVIERKVGPVKTDIKIGLSGQDATSTMKALSMLQNKIESIDGVQSVATNAKKGIDELKLIINEYGQSLGINESLLGSTLSNLFLIKKKGSAFDETDIMDVTIQTYNEDSLDTLYNYQFPLDNNKFVALKDIVNFQIQNNFERVTKEDGVTEFSIFANVNPKVVTASEVLEKIEPTIKQLQDTGFDIRFKGEREKNEELKRDMQAATILSMLLILLSLLYLFNSFKLTFMLLSVIPFSILGVLIGHISMDMNLSMPSIIGTLGLAGVVLNDGIIMLTFLKDVKTKEEFYTQAAKRFRPIILTSITTVIGLSTLIFFATGQAIILQPIAVALGFGLAWGTILNLLYIPALFALFNKNLR